METPVLRIETGFHGLRIWRLDTDEARRWLVTASADKTVRVWDFNSGAPARIIRPPIGDGENGTLYGVAISPDGSTIACGAVNWEGGASLYLFDRASGTLQREIQGFHSAPSDLDFSPDGRFVYFASRDGWISKYDLWGLTLVTEVRAGLNTRNAAVSSDGRIVAVANYLPHSLVLLDDRLQLLKINDVASLAQTAQQGLQRLIDAFDREATPYRALRRARFAAAYRYDDYAHLARVAEWSAETDEEA